MEKVAQQFTTIEFDASQAAERAALIEQPQLLSMELLERVGGGDGLETTSLPGKGW